MTIESKLYIAVENTIANLTPVVTPAPEAELPATNLLDDRRNKVCRITGLADDAIAIKGGSATDYNYSCFAFWGWDFADDVTVRFRIFADDSQGGATMYDSTALSPHVTIPWGSMIPGVDPWGDVYTVAPPSLYIIFFDTVVGKSYQIDIDNPTAATVDMGLIFSGWAWTPSKNIDYGQATGWVDNSIHSRTSGGGLKTQAVDSYRRLSFSLTQMTKLDRETISHLLETAGKEGDILLSLDPNETTRELIENSMICRRVTNNRASRVAYELRSTSLEFEEI